MSAEFFITFADPQWYRNHGPAVAKKLEGLGTCIKRSGDEIWLQGTESRGPERFPFDVRVLLQPDNRILLEVSAHPESIEADLKSFLDFLRSETHIQVLNEDGEESGW